MTRPLRSRSSPWIAILLVLAAGWAAHRPARAERSLYTRMAHADLVVKIRVVEGTLRLAECQVLRVLRGQYTGRTLFVAFRSDNMMRERWRDRIVFPEGSESILLLTPVVDADHRVKSADRFRLVEGFTGKIDLPREGARAQVQAVARLAQILDMSDIHEQWAAHRKLLREINPYLVEAGFEQVLKFRLGRPEMVPLLLRQMGSRHDRFRVAALQVVAQIFRRARRRGSLLGNEDQIVARILTVAIEDPVAAVRVEAIRALHAYGGHDVMAALREVARSDPSQDVRYQATISVYRLSHADPPPQESAVDH
ncbi:MAG: HEAT repeat domain-containing protein [Acidobacteriota bacterium]